MTQNAENSISLQAAVIATDCNQPGAQIPERQPVQHHRVLHLCRRRPSRPAVAGRALMRGFLLDGNQGSVQAACWPPVGEGVSRTEQVASERQIATAMEGALLRPADWLAAMAVNPVQVSKGLCQGSRQIELHGWSCWCLLEVSDVGKVVGVPRELHCTVAGC